jgi:hypothetical protein
MMVWTDASEAGLLNRHGERAACMHNLSGVPRVVFCYLSQNRERVGQPFLK